VRYQSSFHDWVKGKSIYAPVTWVDVPPEVAQHRIARTGEDTVTDQVIQRLVAERQLITEQQLEIAVEHNELCKALLGAVNIMEFKAIRDAAKDEWHNLSIFSRESYGYIQELNLILPNRKSKLLLYDVEKFFSDVAERRYNLKNFLRQEYVYRQSAINEIYENGPMKVHFTMMPYVGMVTRGFAAPKSDYKSDVEDTEYIHALEDLTNWFTLRQENLSQRGKMPRLLINDDEEIIQRCKESTHNVIITDDKKLCREANKVTGNVVYRVPMQWHFTATYFGTPSWEDYLGPKYPGIEWACHLDTGSEKAFEETRFLDGVMLSKRVHQDFNIWKTDRNWKETVHKEEFVDFSDEVPEGADNWLYDQFNVLRERAQHRARFGKSWRS